MYSMPEVHAMQSSWIWMHRHAEMKMGGGAKKYIIFQQIHNHNIFFSSLQKGKKRKGILNNNNDKNEQINNTTEISEIPARSERSYQDRLVYTSPPFLIG